MRGVEIKDKMWYFLRGENEIGEKGERNMGEYYPLTAAQKMHHNWIQNYKTQQVSGVSVVASLKGKLDFGLLKKCIQLEFESY